jgi:hypothetical protein
LASNLPAFAIGPFDPLIEFGDVGDFHVRAVPFHLFPFPHMLGQIAQNPELRHARAVFKRHGRVGPARAAGFHKIGEDGGRAAPKTRQGFRRLGRWHFSVRHDVHVAAVGVRVNDAFLSDVKGAAVAIVQLFLRILFSQLQQKRREIARVAANGMKLSGGTGRGSGVEALVPIDLHRPHALARRYVPANAAAQGIALVAAAPVEFHFDAGGVPDLECPENAVQNMAGHVADGAVAEIVPAVPLVRMQVGVVVAIRRGANPIVPMQSGGHRY